jgi:hypothetical protein
MCNTTPIPDPPEPTDPNLPDEGDGGAENAPQK